jgi:epoxyqueuosine reductase
MKSDLTALIKARALELGFCKVGVAAAGALTPEGGRLQEWLAQGYHGTMDWMARNAERRSDPREILPGARSVLSVAMNYYTEVRHSDDPGAGKISRYAWGDDYHDIVKPKLLELLAYIQTNVPGAEGVAYVDTGPVLEKAWAARAGLGWEGKHTNLITQEFGRGFFWGNHPERRAEYDAPATDHCGTCTLCIEACPTDAIVQPYVLDSNRCISYLTIKHRERSQPNWAKIRPVDIRMRYLPGRLSLE